MPDNVEESPFAELIAVEQGGLADLSGADQQTPAEAMAQAVEQTTSSPQPEGVSDEVNSAMEGKNASEIGALIAQIPPEHRDVVEQLRRVMQSRVDKAKNEMAGHPAMQLWGALENDPQGTIQQMLAHYGMNGTLEAEAEDAEPDPMEQRLAQIEAFTQQKQLEEKIDKAVKTVRDLSRSAQIEITDLEMEEIITQAANNNWNVVKEFKAAIADKLINRQAQPHTVNEKAQGEITDVDALWKSWATQKQ